MANTKYYKYNNIQVQGFKVSPSSFNSLLLSAGDWFNSQVLKQSTFTGNKKTVLGTCIHVRIELYYSGVTFSEPDERTYINSQDLNEEELNYIFTNLEPLWALVLNKYINANPRPQEIEMETISPLPWSDKETLAGTIDILTQDNKILDWKTTEKKPSKMNIGHFIQGLLYAYALQQDKQIVVTAVQICYLVVPTKTLPARMFIFEEPVTEQHMNWIEHQLRILSKKRELVKADPTLQDVVFTPNPDSYLNEHYNPLDALKRTDKSNITFDIEDDDF